MLHIINKSAFHHSPVDSCLDRVNTSDQLLFIEDGVYNGLISSPIALKLEELLKSGVRCYVLSIDVEARALGQRLLSGVELVGDDGFVDLVVQEPQVLSWR